MFLCCKILQAYQNRDYARIVSWPNLRFDRTLRFDPNTELEWRNQPTTHTDCVLHYKQVESLFGYETGNTL